MLKRKEECDTYLTHVCRYHWSRESPVKRWNTRSFQPALWLSYSWWKPHVGWNFLCSMEVCRHKSGRCCFFLTYLANFEFFLFSSFQVFLFQAIVLMILGPCFCVIWNWLIYKVIIVIVSQELWTSRKDRRNSRATLRQPISSTTCTDIRGAARYSNSNVVGVRTFHALWPCSYVQGSQISKVCTFSGKNWKTNQ